MRGFSCMNSVTYIKDFLKGTLVGGGSGVSASSLTSAVGAGILSGSGVEGYVVSSAAASAAAGNALLMGAGGAIVAMTGLHEKLGIFEKPAGINDWVFWAKMAGFVCIKTAGTALGGAMLEGGVSGMTVGATAAANLLGTAVMTIPGAILIYAVHKAVTACKNNSVSKANLSGLFSSKPARSSHRKLTGIRIDGGHRVGR
jgi:hypothetical protein